MTASHLDNIPLPMAVDKTSSTDDERITNVVPLPPPEHLIRFFPVQDTPAEGLINRTRHAVQDILRRKSDRLLVIIGPCSIHDPDAAVEYARRLLLLRERLAADLEIVMRVYFEKPQYIGDLISWGAIGARTTESQVHRELASGLSAPIGFKNGTDGNVKIAIDAILAARQKHHFLSIHKNGQVATVETKGNPDCHIILRGGKSTNYDAESVAAAAKALAAAGLEERLMIDCSHANSQKDHRRQVEVSAEIGRQVAAGEQRIVGVMVESHLVEGRQDLKPGMTLASLNYGQSITDACISWEASVPLLEDLAAAVRARRQRKA